MTRSMLRIWVGIAAAAALAVGSARADLINGDFSSGLDGWSVIGDVSGVAGTADISDNEYYSALYQALGVTDGSYVLEFDFYSGISDEVPDFTFPDVFFASLYFIDDLGAFDLETASYDDALALFDLDYSGVSNLTGEVVMIGQGWYHFTLAFDTTYAYVIPAFELLNQNDPNANLLLGLDSDVYIDNVSIVPGVIPEPSTFVLVGIGGAMFALRMRVRRAA